MTARLTVRSIPYVLAVLVVIAVGVILAIPPEAKLGAAIRVVLLHGALARTGLFLFGVGAVVGALALVRPTKRLVETTRLFQWAALVEWVVYAISSVIATWLTWGVPVAWGEPRTQASAKILIMAIVFVGVTKWTREPRFTAVANIFAGVVSILLVRTAGLVQHPADPVMTAGTSIYPVLFIALWIILSAMSLICVRWVYLKRVAVPS